MSEPGRQGAFDRITLDTPAALGYESLSRFAISRILFVSSLYDYFILEEDGRLGDLLARSNGSAPRLTQISGGENALAELTSGRYDLVVTLMRLGDMDPFTFGRRVRVIAPGMPVMVLAYNTPELQRLVAMSDPGAVDAIFVWLGDGNLLQGMIRMAEDCRNAAADCGELGVPALMVVEDSVFFYSRYLHEIHVMISSLQEGILSSKALSPAQLAVRGRARPKVLLATSREQAEEYLEKYGEVMLGVITDQSFPCSGGDDREAGLRLIERIRGDHPHMPVLLQTSEETDGAGACALGATFVHKSSPTLMKTIRKELADRFGFGPLSLEDPDTGRIDRIETLDSFFLALDRSPATAVAAACEKGAVRRWLMVHAELDLARRLHSVARREGEDDAGLRGRISDEARKWRKDSHRGSIPPYSRSFYEDYAQFSRIGSGSIGGKGRGLAFIDRVLTGSLSPDAFPGVSVSIPRTLVLTTEVFDEFMEQNDLLEPVLSETRDLSIAGRFQRADLPPTVLGDLRDFLGEVRAPLAVRSSSLLEDALYQPFAGIYATKMLPNGNPSFDERFRAFTSAIKLVYSSTYLRQARAYIQSTNHRPEEEKMAVLIQPVVGRMHGERYYPHFSGVGRSYDYYPAGGAKPEDGVVNAAVGLGKTIVDGGVSLRFSPKHPGIMPQFTGVRDMLSLSQRTLWALDMSSGAGAGMDEEEDQYLLRLGLEDAERDGILDWLASTYSPEDDRVYDGITRPGARVVDFAHVLKNRVFPLAEISDSVLEIGRRAMNCPVEIEFAGVLSGRTALPAEFSLLQIRPMVAGDELVTVDLDGVDTGGALCSSGRVLGNGTRSDIADIVFVKPDSFQAANTRAIAREIDSFNSVLAREGRPYLLAGPGRWGSSDPWLGVPVNWSQICGVKAIIEVTMPGMNVDPSQGSHFFQNMTSLRIGYFTVSHSDSSELMDWQWLLSLPAAGETASVRHVRLGDPLTVMIDGRSGRGLVLKPR